MIHDVLLYDTEDGKTRIEPHLREGAFRLTQLELAELFQATKQNISKHVKAILNDGELDEMATVNCQLTVQNEVGRKKLTRLNLIASLDEDNFSSLSHDVKKIEGSKE